MNFLIDPIEFNDMLRNTEIHEQIIKRKLHALWWLIWASALFISFSGNSNNG